jgi:hypothetical protein
MLRPSGYTEIMKEWTEKEIIALLTRDDAVERALVAIFNRQTEDEKRSEDTKHTNTVGFSSSDAKLGTYYAKWVLSGKHLTGSHLERARKMAHKYRRQLTEQANIGRK